MKRVSNFKKAHEKYTKALKYISDNKVKMKNDEALRLKIIKN